MTWHATFLMLYVFCAFACGALTLGAPGLWQRGVMCWYGFGFMVLAVGECYGLSGETWTATVIANVGRIVIVVGVMAHIFRLFIAEQARRCLPNSSLHFRSSAR